MVGTKGKARETSKSARFAAALALACATIPCACRTPENAQYAPAKGVGAFEPEQPNPLFVETTDPYALWDAVVDVIDNYYVIESEIPVRVYERQDTDGRSYQYRTEGRLETEPSRAFSNRGARTAANVGPDGKRPFRRCAPPPSFASSPKGRAFTSISPSSRSSKTSRAPSAPPSDIINSSTTTSPS